MWKILWCANLVLTKHGLFEKSSLVQPHECWPGRKLYYYSCIIWEASSSLVEQINDLNSVIYLPKPSHVRSPNRSERWGSGGLDGLLWCNAACITSYLPQLMTASSVSPASCYEATEPTRHNTERQPSRMGELCSLDGIIVTFCPFTRRGLWLAVFVFIVILSLRLFGLVNRFKGNRCSRWWHAAKETRRSHGKKKGVRYF